MNVIIERRYNQIGRTIRNNRYLTEIIERKGQRQKYIINTQYVLKIINVYVHFWKFSNVFALLFNYFRSISIRFIFFVHFLIINLSVCPSVSLRTIIFYLPYPNLCTYLFRFSPSLPTTNSSKIR